DTVDNGNFPLIPQAFNGPHAGMETEAIIDGQDILGGNLDRRAEIVVQPVGVWDNGIEAVITAAQLDDYKGFVSYGGRHGIPPLVVLAGRFAPSPLPEVAVRPTTSEPSKRT